MSTLYEKLKSIRSSFVSNVYGGRIEKFLRFTRIHDLLNFGYGTIERIYFIIGDLKPESKHLTSINGVSAEFAVTSGRERGFIYSVGSGKGEDPLRKFLINELDSSDVFYDIGANVGQYACFVGQLVDSGNLVCFEPHPKTASRLEENLRMNSVKNFRILNVAVSNESGEVEYDLGTDDPGGMGFIIDQPTKNSVKIHVVSLDDVVNERTLPFPNVIKMDIHGEEWHALKGMEKTLNDSRCRMIICELHERYIEEKGGSIEEIITRMESFGFSHSYDQTDSRVVFSKEGPVEIV